VLRRGAQRRRSSEALIARLKVELADFMRTEWCEREDRTMRTLRASLESLPARDQELLTLSAWEGLTPDQIAVVTGLSANVVRVRLHRARSRLQHRLTQARAAPSDATVPVMSAKTGL
jgi:RNA polymerase sigma factor (sigma-70 family)